MFIVICEFQLADACFVVATNGCQGISGQQEDLNNGEHNQTVDFSPPYP
jgi:hypothetical protein